MIYRGDDVQGWLPNRNAIAMLSQACSALDRMASEHNARDGFFKIQFNLGNFIMLIPVLVPIIIMWTDQIANNARSTQSLEEHTKTLSELTGSVKSVENTLIAHTMTLEHVTGDLGAISKTAQQAMIDDDRLSRVQADMKEIEARIEHIEASINGAKRP